VAKILGLPVLSSPGGMPDCARTSWNEWQGGAPGSPAWEEVTLSPEFEYKHSCVNLDVS
jgi:hypothetical protein